MRKISIALGFILVLILIAKPYTTEAADASQDYIESMNFEADGSLSWDSSLGPLYTINPETGKLINCTSAGGKIIDFSRNGKVITVTVWSEELPENTTYVINMDECTPWEGPTEGEKNPYEQYDFKSYGFELPSNTFWFMPYNSWSGVSVEISTGKQLDGHEIVSISGFEYNGTTVKLKVFYKDEGITVPYEVDVSDYVNSFLNSRDVMEFFYISEGDIIYFDTELGPSYLINYATGELLETNSIRPNEAKIVGCVVDGTSLKITVRSCERPKDETYSFNIPKEKCVIGIGDNISDIVDYYSFFDKGRILEFDSVKGPYYKIDLEKREIISCSSDDMNKSEAKSKIVSFEFDGDKVSLTMYSEELPYNVTYTFNTTNNNISYDLEKIDNTVYEEKFDNVIEKIISSDNIETIVDSETAEKIKAAKNSNKEIITVVETNMVIANKVGEETATLVKRKLREDGLEATQYMNIDVAVYSENEKLGNIKELESPIEFIINVDFNLNETDAIYYVLRIHNGQVDVLETKKVGDNALSFETDRFSTYVLTSKTAQPDSDDSEIIEETESDSEPTNITENNSEKTSFKLWWVLVPAGVVIVVVGICVLVSKLKKEK